MSPTIAVVILLVVWLVTSIVGGALLAALARRIHDGLNYHRLWLVYSALLAFTVAAVMAIAWW